MKYSDSMAQNGNRKCKYLISTWVNALGYMYKHLSLKTQRHIFVTKSFYSEELSSFVLKAAML